MDLYTNPAHAPRPGEYGETYARISQLAPGESDFLNFSMPTTEGGSTIHAQIDADDHIQESNEKNNSDSVAIGWAPQLTISHVDLETFKDIVTVTVEVSNVGNAAAGAFWIDLFENQEFRPDLHVVGNQYRSVGGLDAGESTIWRADFIRKDMARQPIWLTVDQGNQVVEQDETDNHRRVVLTDCLSTQAPAICLLASTLAEHIASLVETLHEPLSTSEHDAIQASLEYRLTATFDGLWEMPFEEEWKTDLRIIDADLADEIVAGDSDAILERAAVPTELIFLAELQLLVQELAIDELTAGDMSGAAMPTKDAIGLGHGSLDNFSTDLNRDALIDRLLDNTSGVISELFLTANGDVGARGLVGPDSGGFDGAGFGYGMAASGGRAEGLLNYFTDVIQNGTDGKEDSAGAKTARTVALAPVIGYTVVVAAGADKLQAVGELVRDAARQAVNTTKKLISNPKPKKKDDKKKEKIVVRTTIESLGDGSVKTTTCYDDGSCETVITPPTKKDDKKDDKKGSDCRNPESGCEGEGSMPADLLWGLHRMLATTSVQDVPWLNPASDPRNPEDNGYVRGAPISTSEVRSLMQDTFFQECDGRNDDGTCLEDQRPTAFNVQIEAEGCPMGPEDFE